MDGPQQRGYLAVITKGGRTAWLAGTATADDRGKSMKRLYGSILRNLDIQGYINEPNINLAKIAAYRALLGIDDREMEEKQGLQFVRIVASRGIENISPSTGDSPIDLSPLERMAFDLGLGRTVR